MNREIKFRLWNKKEKKLVNARSNFGFVFAEFYHRPELHIVRLGYDYKNIEIMQYTGLKDKNGKEIYEGDIVKEGYHEKYGRRAIEWKDDGFNLFVGGDESWEVIGNIYENPELLEQ